MSYNLITEPWLPVVRGAGPPEYIPPWRVTETMPEPYSDLGYGRADLKGAAVQMLIGLLQNACPPEDSAQWLTLFLTPPDPRVLRERFRTLEPAFNLTGDGQRFMQDRDCPVKDEGFPLGQLLPDQPAGNTLRLNKDLFVKEGAAMGICRACLPAALYWRQTTMGGFGGGFRDSLRLNGPLTVTVQGSNLWESLWLNVLPKSEISAMVPEPHPSDFSSRYPWMGKLRMSDKNQTISPQDIHPDHLYWPMSQSLLVDEQNTTTGRCPFCGRDSETLYHTFHRRKHGPLYQKSGFRHPLTPTSFNEQGLPVFLQTPKGGVCYTDWLGIAAKGEARKTKMVKPPVVRAFYQREGLLSRQAGRSLPYKAWVFGLEMEKAKSVYFSSGMMPLIALDEDIRDEFEYEVQGIVQTAEEAAKRLTGILREALINKRNKVNPKAGVLGLAEKAFWSGTEPAFYRLLHQLKDALIKHEDPDQSLRLVKEKWLKTLASHGATLFNRFSDSAQLDKTNPERWAEASTKLKRSLGVNTKKLREMLGLPAPVKQ